MCVYLEGGDVALTVSALLLVSLCSHASIAGLSLSSSTQKWLVVLVAVLRVSTIEAIVFLCKISKQRRKL